MMNEVPAGGSGLRIEGGGGSSSGRVEKMWMQGKRAREVMLLLAKEGPRISCRSSREVPKKELEDA